MARSTKPYSVACSRASTAGLLIEEYVHDINPALEREGLTLDDIRYLRSPDTGPETASVSNDGTGVIRWDEDVSLEDHVHALLHETAHVIQWKHLGNEGFSNRIDWDDQLRIKANQNQYSGVPLFRGLPHARSQSLHQFNLTHPGYTLEASAQAWADNLIDPYAGDPLAAP